MRLFVAALLYVLLTSGSHAWESSRPGPIFNSELKRENRDVDAKIEMAFAPGRSKVAAPTNPISEPEGSLSRRTFEYPYESGAKLGDGWNYISNKRTFSQCIKFGTQSSDVYQSANTDYQRAIDQETLSIALNINTSAKASGGFAGLSANASSSFGLDTSYKLTSKDDTIVAHASVVNSATFVTAQAPLKTSGLATNPSIAGIRLDDEALALLAKPGAVNTFRAACGDGFIAAIGSGADLYLLYHFTDVGQDIRAKLSTSMSAGGGVSGLFKAGGSISTSLDFQKNIDESKLGIYYVQNGGKIGSLPVSVADVEDRVKKLPSEAFDHGRPLYIIVVPYTELYNWPYNINPFKTIDLRSSLVRSAQRLASAYVELQVIIADFRSQKSRNDSQYFHDEFHGLRRVDYALLSDTIKLEIEKVQNALQLLDEDCIKTPNTNAARDRAKAPQPRRQVLVNFIPKLAASSCEGRAKTYLEQQGFSDLVYDLSDYVRTIYFPVPTNSVSSADLDFISDQSKDVYERKYKYSILLYNHWVDRVYGLRCSMFFECLDKPTRTRAYGLIKSSLDLIP